MSSPLRGIALVGGTACAAVGVAGVVTSSLPILGIAGGLGVAAMAASLVADESGGGRRTEVAGDPQLAPVAQPPAASVTGG